MKRNEIITKTIAGEEKSYKFDVEFNYGSILSYPYCKGYYLLAYPMKQLGLNMVEDSEFEVKTLLFEIDKPDDTSLEFALRVADQYIDTSILQIEQKKIEKDRKISKNRDKIDKEVKGIESYDYEFDFNVDEYLSSLGVEIDRDDFKNNKEGNDEDMGKFNGRGYKTNKDDDDKRLRGIEESEYYVKPDGKTTFESIAGMIEVKREAMEMVDVFKNREKYEEMGVTSRMNNLLLSGSPGCGKTLLVKAIANELGLPLFQSSGEFTDRYAGTGARNVKKIFNDARKYSPSILFIDEAEQIGKKRSGESNNAERESATAELLNQLDGFSTTDNVIVILATNLPESLDPALLRRMSKKIHITEPDFLTRLGILKVNAERMKMEDDVDLEKIARNLAGYNGGIISNIMNQAGMIAVRKGLKKITQTELEEAMEKETCGLKSETKKVNEEEKNVIAYHECGHSITTYLLKKEKIQKISILPRTNSVLGFVYYANEDDDDRFLQTKEEMLNSIVVALAGRASEEIVLGKVTGGCSNDLEKATHLAETMVTKLGMSETFGLISINSNDIFMREKVVNEVNNILNDCYKKAKEILNENRELLDALAKRLIDKEEMNLEDFEEVLAEVENK